MDTSIHVIQPFLARPITPDRRRRDRNPPAFDLKSPPADAPGAPIEEDEYEPRSSEAWDELAPMTARAHASEPTIEPPLDLDRARDDEHEEGLGERVDVVA